MSWKKEDRSYQLLEGKAWEYEGMKNVERGTKNVKSSSL
jgi:hypothetical protein